MKYMFLIYSTESDWTADTRQSCMVESIRIGDELAEAGKFIAASPLEYVSSAVCVRVRNRQTLITTGPFAETTEQLGGFYILELGSLDEAIDVAGRLPPAQKGTVEIRPIFQLDELPPDKITRMHEHDGKLQPFLLLCYDDEEYWNSAGAEARHAAMLEAAGVAHELDVCGKYISASPLHSISTATSVRVRSGQRLVTDGPFAETREVLGGYYLVLARDQREAGSIAAKHPGVRVGTVEVRPLFDTSEVRDSLTPRKKIVDPRNPGTTV